MRQKGLREAVLNVGTAAVVGAAAVTVARERILPAWRDHRRLDPGDVLPRELRFERLADSTRLPVESGRPTLLLVFRSTCSACERIAPAWRTLIRRSPGMVLAVALEPASTGLSYAESRLPGATPVRPTQRDLFVDRLRIRVVPTTLLIDSDGRLRRRSEGTLDDGQVASLLAEAGESPGRRHGSTGGPASASGSAGQLEPQNDGR